jgi:hypothetical protein
MRDTPWYIYALIIVLILGFVFTSCAPVATPSPEIVTKVVQTTDLVNYEILYNDGNTKVIKFVDVDTTCYLAENTSLRVAPSIFCIK